MTASILPFARELRRLASSPGVGGRAVERLAFVASETNEAQQVKQRLGEIYGDVRPEESDVIVVVGGDGAMLQTLHAHLCDWKPVYGMSQGKTGFLMNAFNEEGLIDRLKTAEISVIHPLRMVATDVAGDSHEAIAINEVSLFRQSQRAARLRILIDGKERMDELVADGALVATPAGSTAYNLSANGPILPLSAPLLALTPISAFRPRRWRGAILPDAARIRFEVIDPDQCPVGAVANNREFRKVRDVSISKMAGMELRLMFDRGHTLGERMLDEQFTC